MIFLTYNKRSNLFLLHPKRISSRHKDPVDKIVAKRLALDIINLLGRFAVLQHN